MIQYVITLFHANVESYNFTRFSASTKAIFMLQNKKDVCLLESRRVDLCQLLKHCCKDHQTGAQAWRYQGEIEKPSLLPVPCPERFHRQLICNTVETAVIFRMQPPSVISPLSSSRNGKLENLSGQSTELLAIGSF